MDIETIEKLQCDLISKNKIIFINDDIVGEILLSIEKKLNMKEIDRSQITDTLLHTAAEMFVYLTNCPRDNLFTKQKHFAEFFANASPRTIVETVLSINKLL